MSNLYDTDLQSTIRKLGAAISRNVPDADGRYEWITENDTLHEAQAACAVLAHLITWAEAKLNDDSPDMRRAKDQVLALVAAARMA